jgi:hypothetical protein
MIKTKWFLAASMAAFAIVSGWLWYQLSAPSVARDFEECAEQAEAASVAQRTTFLTDCGARFAGRRKPGGGYSYYDFMQDRSFDIVGPNPTPDERKQIDREYMKYLDSARLDILSAELAQQQNHIPVADLSDTPPAIGRPIVLTSSAKSAANRSKDPPAPCLEAALACSWEKVTSAVRSAFASTSKPE